MAAMANASSGGSAGSRRSAGAASSDIGTLSKIAMQESWTEIVASARKTSAASSAALKKFVQGAERRLGIEVNVEDPALRDLFGHLLQVETVLGQVRANGEALLNGASSLAVNSEIIGGGNVSENLANGTDTLKPLGESLMVFSNACSRGAGDTSATSGPEIREVLQQVPEAVSGAIWQTLSESPNANDCRGSARYRMERRLNDEVFKIVDDQIARHDRLREQVREREEWRQTLNQCQWEVVNHRKQSRQPSTQASGLQPLSSLTVGDADERMQAAQAKVASIDADVLESLMDIKRDARRIVSGPWVALAKIRGEFFGSLAADWAPVATILGTGIEAKPRLGSDSVHATASHASQSAPVEVLTNPTDSQPSVVAPAPPQPAEVSASRDLEFTQPSENGRTLTVDGFEARATEVGTVVADFKAGNEESSGTFPFTRVRLYRSGEALMYGDVLALLASGRAEGKSLRTLYGQVLAGVGGIVPFQEYFFECRPVSEELMEHTVFEFVSIEATEMGKKATDANAFDDKFVDHMGTLAVLQFMTPAPAPKETNLIVPARAPGTDLPVYRSMGSFCKGAPAEQVDAMLQKLGAHMPERMKIRGDPTLPLWVSTAGYDVAWLHLRLDNVPKYYRFKEYKDEMVAQTAVAAQPAAAAEPSAAATVDSSVEARRRVEEEELQRARAEEEMLRLKAEEDERVLRAEREEAERIRAEEDAARLKVEEEERLRKANEEDAAMFKAEEEERLRKADEEAKRIRAEEDAARVQAEEEERSRKAQEDAERLKAEEDERLRKANEEEEAMARLKVEQEERTAREEEEARIRAEEQAAQARRLKAAEEEEEDRLEAEEKARLGAEEADSKLQQAGGSSAEEVPADSGEATTTSAAEQASQVDLDRVRQILTMIQHPKASALRALPIDKAKAYFITKNVPEASIDEAFRQSGIWTVDAEHASAERTPVSAAAQDKQEEF